VSISASKVGHVVLRVSNLERALSFYEGVLGLRAVARRDFGEGPMVFLSSGHSHHDLALLEVSTPPTVRGTALHHLAIKVGDSRQDLTEAEKTLESCGIGVHMALDHHVSQGLYVSDPDGNLVELYVDADEQIWRNDPSQVANSDPLNV
jgi:catechol 2,3-dioxygenase